MTVFGKIFADIHSWDWYQLKPDGAHPASEQDIDRVPSRPFAFSVLVFVLGLPHVRLIGLRQALISYQD